MEHEFVKTQGSLNQDELMKGSSVFSDAKKGPADAPKADPGPNALSDLLTKLLQNKANKEQESADVKDPPITQVLAASSG